MPSWVWFSAAIVLSIAEMVGGQFFLLMLGGGALAASGIALIPGSPVWLELIVFAIVSVALVLGARPPMLRHFQALPGIKSGIDAIIGSKAMVVSTVDSDGGQVKIGGEVWSAMGVQGNRPLPPGTPVTVVEVRGATAVVIWGP